MREWIPALNPTRKWRQVMRDMQVDDVVLLAAADTPRGQWPMGRIVEVYPGVDGHVRVAKVKLANGKIVVRPIAKLCILVPTMNIVV